MILGTKKLRFDGSRVSRSLFFQQIHIDSWNRKVAIFNGGLPRALVWGMPWRSNVEFVGQAYCVGGKSLYWGGWCPRLEADDLTSWPPSVAQYFTQHYPTLERQVGAAETTDFIEGPLFDLLKPRFTVKYRIPRVPIPAI